MPVLGFDIDAKRVYELRAGQDRTREVDSTDLQQASLHFECEPLRLADADFYIVTVPTPIDGIRPTRPQCARFGFRNGRQSAQARRHRGL